jgi:D-alanine-D-alanine ligase
MSKIIAIVFGSLSYEHEISIVSAISMKKVINNELKFIFIDKHREFYEIPNDKITSKLFSSGQYKKMDKLNITHSGFIKYSLFGNKYLDYDVVLNLVHGGDGEDGVLSSLFEFFSIPFIGPRNKACIVSNDKFITKTYAQDCNVNTLGATYFPKDKIDDIQIKKYPVIVKPATLGSSIAISIVKNENELSYALDTAFEVDDAIIIEQFIENVKEYNLAGTKIDGEFIFSLIEEPLKEEFLDFDKKYLDFARTSVVNKANISDNMNTKLKENFMKIYNNVFDGALIRCDFFVIDDEIYLNEINPIPGSMSNYLFENFNELINNLSMSLPNKKNIEITYEYVNTIQNAKGK